MGQERKRTLTGGLNATDFLEKTGLSAYDRSWQITACGAIPAGLFFLQPELKMVINIKQKNK